MQNIKYSKYVILPTVNTKHATYLPSKKMLSIQMQISTKLHITKKKHIYKKLISSTQIKIEGASEHLERFCCWHQFGCEKHKKLLFCMHLCVHECIPAYCHFSMHVEGGVMLWYKTIPFSICCMLWECFVSACWPHGVGPHAALIQ